MQGTETPELDGDVDQPRETWVDPHDIVLTTGPLAVVVRMPG